MKKLLLSIFGFVASFNFAQAQCNELFISEYVEGSGNNKAIEIYNPTNNPVSLANYRLIRHDNGNSNTLEPIDPQHVLNLPVNITLASKDVYVMALNLTDPNGTGQSAPIDLELQAVADTLLCPGCATGTGQPRVLCFNGDDALALQKNVGGTWSNVDIFACIGEQPKNNNGTASPTAGWTILPPFSSMPVGFTPPGAYFLQYWTQDKTLFRKYDVQNGVTVNPQPATFDASVQWDSLPVNTFYGLGSHECICACSIFNGVTVSFQGDTVVCQGQSTSITTNVYNVPGNPTLSYSWSNGTLSQTALLPVGTFTVTISDPQGCSITKSISIVQKAAPSAQFTTANPSACGASDGSASIVVSGANAPFQYLWENGVVNDTISNIGAGSYSCVVTDATGCTFTYFASISDPGGSEISSSSVVAASCDTCANGSITVSVTGAANVIYIWTLGNDTIANSTLNSVSNLNPGTYTLTLLEGPCSSYATFTVGNTVGIAENFKKLTVVAFPNPAQNNITFSAGSEIKLISIFDYSSKILFDVCPNSPSSTIDISNLSAGIYFARIINKEGKVGSTRFTKN
jgi:hypothetical protein